VKIEEIKPMQLQVYRIGRKIARVTWDTGAGC